MKLDERIAIGSVIFEKVFDTNPPKDKYYIVTGFTADLVTLSTVYINTHINVHVFPTQRLRDLHVLISCDDNPFLKYDSFVDCSNLHVKNTQQVLDMIIGGNAKYGYIATVSLETLEKVLHTIKTAPTISYIQKKRLGLL